MTCLQGTYRIGRTFRIAETSNYFGYKIVSTISWEGQGDHDCRTLVTTSHVTNPRGVTTVAYSRPRGIPGTSGRASGAES